MPSQMPFISPRLVVWCGFLLTRSHVTRSVPSSGLLKPLPHKHKPHRPGQKSMQEGCGPSCWLVDVVMASYGIGR